MKIIEWFKKIFSKKETKKIAENCEVTKKIEKDPTEFIPKVGEEQLIKQPKTREEIIKSMNEKMITEENIVDIEYNEFTAERIRENYDKEGILSEEDTTSLYLLYEAVKDGNIEEPETNKINEFLKKSEDNLIVLVNLMEKDAKEAHTSLDSEVATKTPVKNLLRGSYKSIVEDIEKYNSEQEQIR